MDDHEFCRQMLRDVRKRLTDSPESARALKGLYVDHCSTIGNKRYFWVRLADRTVIWEGTDCCVYIAKATAIASYLGE